MVPHMAVEDEYQKGLNKAESVLAVASVPDEKKGEISEDDRKRSETEVQKLTDSTIADVDAAAAAKEKEILGK